MVGIVVLVDKFLPGFNVNRAACSRTGKRWHAWAVGNCPIQKKVQEPGTHNAYIIAEYEKKIIKRTGHNIRNYEMRLV